MVRQSFLCAARESSLVVLVVGPPRIGAGSKDLSAGTLLSGCMSQCVPVTQLLLTVPSALQLENNIWSMHVHAMCLFGTARTAASHNDPPKECPVQETCFGSKEALLCIKIEAGSQFSKQVVEEI